MQEGTEQEEKEKMAMNEEGYLTFPSGPTHTRNYTPYDYVVQPR